jgi:hypothetical protein
MDIDSSPKVLVDVGEFLENLVNVDFKQVTFDPLRTFRHWSTSIKSKAASDGILVFEEFSRIAKDFLCGFVEFVRHFVALGFEINP